MNYSKYIFASDIDGTMTYEKFPSKNIDLEKTREFIRNVEPRKGIEILSLLCIKPLVVTGRGNYFENDTVHWLDKVNVKYTKLFTFDRTEERGFQQYIDYKVNICVENNVDYCLEDDIRVANKLEQRGIKCSIVKSDESYETAFFRLFDEERK